MTLRPGDRIDTGPRADAVLRYASGTEVVLRPNSGGRIGSLTEFVGEVFVKVKGFFSVDTTFVKAGARGTAYLVRTHAGGTTSVIVIEGIVDVGSTTGAWPTVPLSAGTMTLAHPRAPQPMPANVDDLARTRDWVDRVERLVPPPGGVSRSALIAIGFAAAIAAAILLNRNKSSDRGDPPPATTSYSCGNRQPRDASAAASPAVATASRTALDSDPAPSRGPSSIRRRERRAAGARLAQVPASFRSARGVQVDVVARRLRRAEEQPLGRRSPCVAR